MAQTLSQRICKHQHGSQTSFHIIFQESQQEKEIRASCTGGREHFKKFLKVEKADLKPQETGYNKLLLKPDIKAELEGSSPTHKHSSM